MASEEWKRAAAQEAAKLVKDGMVVGLGAGTTVAEIVRELSKSGPDATFVASSSATQQLADKLGLRLGTLDQHSELDLMLDGADEVAPDFSMIKGGGGAHTREKIVASAAKRVIIVVNRTKLVRRLGEQSPVPVEVLPFAHGYIEHQLKKLGGEPQMRKSSTGQPFVTDDGNYILDVKFKSIENPAELERAINRAPGVIENGLFVGVADHVLVGHEGGCETLRAPRDFSKFVRGG